MNATDLAIVGPPDLWDLRILGGPIENVEEQRLIAMTLVLGFNAAAKELPLGTCAWKTGIHRSEASTYVKLWAEFATYTIRLSGHRTLGIFHSDLRDVPTAGFDMFLQPTGVPVAAETLLSKALLFFAKNQGFEAQKPGWTHVSTDDFPDPVFAKPSNSLVIKSVTKGVPLLPRRAGGVLSANSKPINPHSLVVTTDLHLLKGNSHGC